MGLNEAEVKRSILTTLSYHNFFDYPLTKKEIIKYFISSSKKNANLSIINQTLNKLVCQKIIEEKNGFYFLKNKKDLVFLRKKRKKYSQKKLKIAKNFLKYLKLIPWIKMIAVTGALAMENSSKDDDIDLFIITQENRLWLTRLLLIVILIIIGKRPEITKYKKDIKDKICPNLFLDERALGLKKSRQNLFIAHEIAQSKPILNKDNTYQNFLSQNKWVENYLVNAFQEIDFDWLIINKHNKKNNNKALFLLNRFCYKLQVVYMKSKKTSEQINLNSAFFHLSKDRGKEILKKVFKNMPA